MSTIPNNRIFGQSDDPRKTELIQSVIEKTRQGKIPWVRQASALTAIVPGGFQINFVLAPITILTPFSTWQLLTIRDRMSSELVRVINSAVPSALAGLPKSTLVEAADQLFTLLTRSADDDLDRAINTIKGL